MKKGLLILTAALALLCLGATAHSTPLPDIPRYAERHLLGSDCGVVRTFYRAPAVVYHAPIVRAVYAEPVYTVWGPPAPTDQTDRVAKLTDDLVKSKDEQIQLLKAIIASGGAGIGPELKGLKPEHPGDKLERESCVRCHSAEDKAKDGGKRILFKGGVFAGTDEDLADMRDAVEAERMPKKTKWTDRERMLYMSWMTRRPPSGEAPKAEAKKPVSAGY